MNQTVSFEGGPLDGEKRVLPDTWGEEYFLHVWEPDLTEDETKAMGKELAERRPFDKRLRYQRKTTFVYVGSE